LQPQIQGRSVAAGAACRAPVMACARRIEGRLEMTPVAPIPIEELAELVRTARANAALWAELKRRELEMERMEEADREARQIDRPVPDAPELRAFVPEVADLLKRRDGADYQLDTVFLVLMLRRPVREELGLWVDFDV